MDKLAWSAWTSVTPASACLALGVREVLLPELKEEEEEAEEAADVW